MVAMCGAGRPLLAGETEGLTVAVFDFESADARLKESGAQLAQLLTAKLSTRELLIMVERQDLAKLLGEQEVGVSGLVNPGSAARIGQLTRARVLITSRVFAAGGETTAVLKIVGSETGRVFGETVAFPSTGSLTGPAERLAAKVAGLLKAQRTKLVGAAISARRFR